MSEKKQIVAPAMLKQTAIMLAVVTFALGFFTGAGFTVYKTNLTAGNTSN